MHNEIKPLEQMVAERSEFGARKYQVPNPDPTGPWGDAKTVELFWFRDLPQDMREELADAEVYAQRLKVRLDAHVGHSLVLDERMKSLVRDLLTDCSERVAQAYMLAEAIGGLLREADGDLTTDRVEHWGPFSKRL